MPETFRESGDPEAAAVFEEGGSEEGGYAGGCNGLHMYPSPLERASETRSAGHFHLRLLLSLIIRAGKLGRCWSSGGESEGALAVRSWRGGGGGVRPFMWFSA